MITTPPGTDATELPSGIGLSFEQTVPRDLAHRRQIGEVFVADSAQSSPEDFYLAYQVPRAHSLWSDQPAGQYDPFATAEAARQSIFVLLHRHIGVPVGLPFTLQRVALRVCDPDAYIHDGTTALQGHVHYRVASREDRGSDVVSMTLEGSIAIGGRRAMTLNADLAFMTQEDYDVFRAFQRAQKPVATARRTPSSALAPAMVGRDNPQNVVIAAMSDTSEDGTAVPDTARYLLAIDHTHPAFFDHEYDHVPGPLMVEGLRQAAIAAAVRSGALPSPAAAFVVGCDAAFLDFAEFEGDLVYEATAGRPDADGRISVSVGLLQFGQSVVQGRIELLANHQATRIHGE